MTGIYSTVRFINRIQNNLRPHEAHNVPVTRPDPGPDGVVGNGDDGRPITYFEFPTTLQGSAFEELMRITDRRADQNYRTIEVAGIKRLANRWMFTASYSATKKHKPVATGAFNPNTEINTADFTWDWDAKFTGTYIFPAGVDVSANLHHTSGNPFARQVQLRGGRTIPSIGVNAEPFGTRRSPNINLLTLRVEKTFNVLTTSKLAVRLNVHNAMNSSVAVASGVNPSLNPRAGVEFLRPRAIIPPRVAEVGVAYTF